MSVGAGLSAKPRPITAQGSDGPYGSIYYKSAKQANQASQNNPNGIGSAFTKEKKGFIGLAQ